jgi:hypothetical protein
VNKTEYTRKLEMALWELIRRWPGERGYAIAIEQARGLLLGGAGATGEQAAVSGQA